MSKTFGKLVSCSFLVFALLVGTLNAQDLDDYDGQVQLLNTGGHIVTFDWYLLFDSNSDAVGLIASGGLHWGQYADLGYYKFVQLDNAYNTSFWCHREGYRLVIDQFNDTDGNIIYGSDLAVFEN